MLMHDDDDDMFFPAAFGFCPNFRKLSAPSYACARSSKLVEERLGSESQCTTREMPHARGHHEKPLCSPKRCIAVVLIHALVRTSSCKNMRTCVYDSR